jgi:hypothetical protein
MPRIRELTFDNLKVKIAPLSYDEAEAYILEGKEMLARDPKPSLEEWAKRTLDAVVLALNRAAAATNSNGNNAVLWDVKKVTTEFDMVTVQQIYEEFMKMSGLLRVNVPAGEAPATSISS